MFDCTLGTTRARSVNGSSGNLEHIKLHAVVQTATVQSSPGEVIIRAVDWSLKWGTKSNPR